MCVHTYMCASVCACAHVYVLHIPKCECEFVHEPCICVRSMQHINALHLCVSMSE